VYIIPVFSKTHTVYYKGNNMKKIISTLIVIFVAWGLMISDADARRFGGGRSFGMQRSSSSYTRPSASPVGQAASTGNKWLGPLAGLAAGGLLASLFMGHGLGSGILSWLLIGGAFFLFMNWFQRRNSPKPQYSSPERNTFNQNVSPFTNVNAAMASNTSGYPAGFDAADFLRNAKVQFIRLQAAYDTKNTADLRDFTAPEVFAEIQMQFQERQDAANQTEVVSLNAELNDVTNEAGGILASVAFSGTIREEVNGPAEPFKETWHFQKNNDIQKWLLVGLQQD
jgi:predicted lipid-binding transport protein (Tim44 family)